MDKKETYLRNYAAWYAGHYLPSQGKLHAQLLKKTKNEHLAAAIMAEIAPHIDDQKLAISHVQFLSRTHSKQYIKNKLIQKLFGREVIEQALSEITDDHQALQIEVEKYRRLNIDNNKILSRLLRKGFRYNEIKEIL